MKPKTLALSFALGLGCIAAGLLSLGCAGVTAGSDPLVVRVEQAETAGYATFDLFLKQDDAWASNPVTSNTWAPAHAFAQYLRKPVPNGTNTVPFGIGAILSLDQVKLSYESGASTSNALVTALSVLSTTETQAQQYSTLITNAP
jgi:hypothetical protein